MIATVRVPSRSLSMMKHAPKMQAAPKVARGVRRNRQDQNRPLLWRYQRTRKAGPGDQQTKSANPFYTNDRDVPRAYCENKNIRLRNNIMLMPLKLFSIRISWFWTMACAVNAVELPTKMSSDSGWTFHATLNEPEKDARTA